MAVLRLEAPGENLAHARPYVSFPGAPMSPGTSFYCSAALKNKEANWNAEEKAWTVTGKPRTLLSLQYGLWGGEPQSCVTLTPEPSVFLRPQFLRFLERSCPGLVTSGAGVDWLEAVFCWLLLGYLTRLGQSILMRTFPSAL